MSHSAAAPSKQRVREFWDAEPCGTRYMGDDFDFQAHARARYALEPYIHEFAGFATARGQSVLEIGVGMGADYLEWLKAGAHAVGVDLSEISLQRARRRCELAGFESNLRVADAEGLPFETGTFDIVYSYGVMHHSPNTQRCIHEACRVLKPGGRARIMLYAHPSLTGLMLWLRYGLLRGRSLRRTVFEQLESPGTNTFTRGELKQMFSDFEDVQVRQVFSPGDLLLSTPSTRFRSPCYSLVWKLYPRWLVRILGRRLGLFLLVSATKPLSPWSCADRVQVAPAL
jgi:ubiquinone/menaquinone biosynthesis C-methylase UbiE